MQNNVLRFLWTKTAIALAISLSLLGLLFFTNETQAQGVHGIGFAKGCTSPIDVGNPYTCDYAIFNNSDTGNGSVADTLTITSITDQVFANPSTINSGNILPLLTLTLNGGATCDSGQTVCTLPPGSSITSATYSFYTADADDPSPLLDTASLVWQDLCTSGANNCPAGNRTNQAGSQATINNSKIIVQKTD